MRKMICWLAVLAMGAVAGTPGLRAQASAPAQATTPAQDRAAVEALYQQFTDAFNKSDLSGIMACYGHSLFVFDVVPPREYATWDAYKRDWETLLANFPGPVNSKVLEMNLTVAGPVAYTHYVDDAVFTQKDGTKVHWVVRITDVLRNTNGKWQIVMEHVSVPVDPDTGKADMLSTK
jgi:ketosteroid isomerase-like protein